MDIGHAIVSSESVIRYLIADGSLLASHSLVESAPKRERRVACVGVIHSDATEVNILRLGSITSIPETNVAKSKACNVVEGVV